MFSEPQSFFHESYFEHPCSVVTERDVLFTDIRGVGWPAVLRRWWHNWFLLSDTDSRCRDYYSSSQAMRQERARQYRLYKSSIHPFSKFSSVWASFIIIISALNRFVFNHSSSVPYGTLKHSILNVGIVFEVILLFDLIVVLKTGYPNSETRKVELSFSKCLMHRCSTNIFFFVASAMPLQCIMKIRFHGVDNCVYCRGNLFTFWMQVLSTFGLFRVYDILFTWSRERRTFVLTYFFRLLRILILATSTMLQFINVKAAMSKYFAIIEQVVDLRSTFHKALAVRHLVEKETLYFASMQFSMVCKFLFSYGMVGQYSDYYYLNAISGILGFFLANVFKFWAFIEWYIIISREKSRADVRSQHKETTMNYLRSKQVSDACSAKIRDYFDYIMSSVKVVESANDLYQVLPTTILREMKLNSYYNFVKRIPYFAEWPVEMLEKLTMLLKEEVFLEKDMVAEKWMPGEGLEILYSGVLAVYSASGREVGHLIDGDFFGELSLVTDREIRISSVIAVNPSKVLFLSKNDFRRYMHNHADRFFELRSLLRNKFCRDGKDSNSGNESVDKARMRMQSVSLDRPSIVNLYGPEPEPDEK